MLWLAGILGLVATGATAMMDFSVVSEEEEDNADPLRDAPVEPDAQSTILSDLEVPDDNTDGGAGNDLIVGTNDNDILNGGLGDDDLQGSAGDDTLYGDDGDDVVNGFENDMMSSHLRDTDSGDFLNGGAGDDVIFAGQMDSVTGGSGADTIVTGDWNAAGYATDILDFDANDDSILLVHRDGEYDPEISLEPHPKTEGITQIMMNGVVVANVLNGSEVSLDDISVVERTTISIDHELPDDSGLIGTTDEDDAVSGSPDNETIHGEDGNDTIGGGAGHDTLHGGRGTDVMDGGDDNDSIFGNNGNDILNGGSGDDYLHGSAGDDALYGDDGNDAVYGGGDNDTVSGGQGHDTVSGGHGDDVINGVEDDTTTAHLDDTDSGDFLNGGSGDDVIIAGQQDSVTAGSGADTIVAGDWIEAGRAASLIDFVARDDSILLVYADGEDEPDISLEPDPETQGATQIMMNGVVVANVLNGSEVSLDDITVMPLTVAQSAGMVSL